MSLQVCSIASGSNGNCYYIGNEQDAMLVDIGISCREVERRMRRQGLDPRKIKAVFISHEHTDHIAGVQAFAKKYPVPVYISASTLSHARLGFVSTITPLVEGVMETGTLTVSAFKKVHDAAEPFSFVVSNGMVNIGVMTDLGVACDAVKKHFNTCHAVFLETNYDRHMLMSGTYPWHLKNRISGGRGHISNDQALELFLNHRGPQLTHLFFSHLSKNNNCPEKVQQLFERRCNRTHFVLASRYQESAVYHIGCPIVGKQPAPKMVQGELAF